MRRRSSLLLATVLAVLGFLLVTAAYTTRQDKRAAEPRKAELIRQLALLECVPEAEETKLRVVLGGRDRPGGTNSPRSAVAAPLKKGCFHR